MSCCIYLRKSRADLEAEAQGAGDTLRRHEEALTALARARGLHIAHVYREIVSGDTISARPQMQKMLADVEARRWEGVLCMEVERLARGDTIDQGIVAQTFRCTGTAIITPQKVYDPRDDMDEEFFEFSLFMARREYKAIKRRLMAGRMASAREGNYLAPKPTYGYARVRAQGRGARWKLVVIPDEAAVVRCIFDWYDRGMDGRDVGAQAICARLNAMGLRTAEGRAFYPSGVRAMLHNATYTGALTWNKRVRDTAMSSGARVTRRVRNPDPIVVPGTHESIVSPEQFERVQRKLAARATSCARTDRVPRNPLRGLIVCGACGGRMQRKARAGRGGDLICCPTPGCPTCAAQLSALEALLLGALEGVPALSEAHCAGSSPDPGSARALEGALKRRRAQLELQRRRVHELLESDVYDPATYAARLADISEQIERATSGLDALAPPSPAAMPADGQPVSLLSEYARATSPEEKRRLLASVVEHVVYRREVRARRGGDAAQGIALDIYLRQC